MSVGCGPAIVEAALSKQGFRVTGLDVRWDMLACAPEHVRRVAARAEDMPFRESAFDAVIYVASLQFVEDYRKAIVETARVVRPDGKIIVMLLNPESAFFREKVRHADSYVRRIRLTRTDEIEAAISEGFYVQTEYFLGLRGGKIFEEGRC